MFKKLKALFRKRTELAPQAPTQRCVEVVVVDYDDRHTLYVAPPGEQVAWRVADDTLWIRYVHPTRARDLAVAMYMTNAVRRIEAKNVEASE